MVVVTRSWGGGVQPLGGGVYAVLSNKILFASTTGVQGVSQGFPTILVFESGTLVRFCRNRSFSGQLPQVWGFKRRLFQF